MDQMTHKPKSCTLTWCRCWSRIWTSTWNRIRSRTGLYIILVLSSRSRTSLHFLCLIVFVCLWTWISVVFE